MDENKNQKEEELHKELPIEKEIQDENYTPEPDSEQEKIPVEEEKPEDYFQEETSEKTAELIQKKEETPQEEASIDALFNKKDSIPTQIIQLSVVLMILAIVAYLVITFIMSFIKWVVLALAVAVLLINYKMLGQILGKIKAYYKDKPLLGVVASVGAILSFVPFVGFLFLKTVWDFRKSDFLPRAKK